MQLFGKIGECIACTQSCDPFAIGGHLGLFLQFLRLYQQSQHKQSANSNLFNCLPYKSARLLVRQTRHIRYEMPPKVQISIQHQICWKVTNTSEVFCITMYMLQPIWQAVTVTRKTRSIGMHQFCWSHFAHRLSPIPTNAVIRRYSSLLTDCMLIPASNEQSMALAAQFPTVRPASIHFHQTSL